MVEDEEELDADEKISEFYRWFKWQEPDIDPENMRSQMYGFEVIEMARKYVDVMKKLENIVRGGP